MKDTLQRLSWALMILLWKRTEATLEGYKQGTKAMVVPHRMVEWGMRLKDWWSDWRLL